MEITDDVEVRVHEEISAKPSSGALAHVCKPEDGDKVEKDIERNLKLYSIAEAVRSGCLPSNRQLDAFLAECIDSIPPASTSRWAAETIDALDAIRDGLGTVRKILRRKNADELLQDTLWLIYAESRGDSGELSLAAQHVKTLAAIIATNSDVRSALSELVVMARDMITRNKDDVVPEPELHPPVVDGTESDLPMPGGFGGEDDWASSVEEFVDAAEDLDESSDLVNKCRKAINSLQATEGYTDAMIWLLDVFEAYQTEKYEYRHPHATDVPATKPYLEGTQRILRNIFTLLERFADGRSLAGIQDDMDNVYDDIEKEPELKALWLDIDVWLRKVLVQRGWVNTSECEKEGEELRARGKKWLDNKIYAAHWNTLCWGVSTWLGIDTSSPPTTSATAEKKDQDKWFRYDPLTREMEQNWENLTNALIRDQKGRLRVKNYVWSELAEVFLPSAKRWGYVTIPRLEFTSPKIELVFENIHVSLANLLPTLMAYEEHKSRIVSPFDAMDEYCSHGTSTRVRLQVSQIQAEIHQAMLLLDWKKFGVKDAGMVDATIARRGLSADITLDIDTRRSAPFVIRLVKAKIGFDQVALRASGTKRDRLYAVLLPLLGTPILKRRLAAKIKKKLFLTVETLNAELVLIRDRIAQADDEAEAVQRRGEETPTSLARALNILSARRRELVANRVKLDITSDIASRARAMSISSLETHASALPKRFKLSASLQNAILPHKVYDKSKSLLYRRQAAEEATHAVEKEKPTGWAVRNGRGSVEIPPMNEDGTEQHHTTASLGVPAPKQEAYFTPRSPTGTAYTSSTANTTNAIATTTTTGQEARSGTVAGAAANAASAIKDAVVDKVANTASRVTGSAKEAKDAVEDKVDDAKAALGHGHSEGFYSGVPCPKPWVSDVFDLL